MTKLYFISKKFKDCCLLLVVRIDDNKKNEFKHNFLFNVLFPYHNKVSAFILVGFSDAKKWRISSVKRLLPKSAWLNNDTDNTDNGRLSRCSSLLIGFRKQNKTLVYFVLSHGNMIFCRTFLRQDTARRLF